MALFRDDPGFGDAIGIAAEQLGFHPQFVEKDYWVTETLRVLATEFPGHFTFKGGTSLSKGYGLIQRFSEDVDILVTANAGDGHSKRENKLREMSECVAGRLGLELSLDPNPGRGKSANRADLLAFEPLAARTIDTGIEEAGVLLETGFAGGEVPAEMVEIDAMLIAPLDIDATEFDDVAPFKVRALAPVRTCLEKICGLHHLATRMLDEPDMDVPREGRHYWDIDLLLGNPTVRKQLADRDSFQALVEDVERISAQHFGGCTPRPEGGFAKGPAFEPPPDIRDKLEALYDRARVLLPTTATTPWSSFGKVLKRISAQADLL